MELEEGWSMHLKAHRIGGWLYELMFSLVTYEFERKLKTSKGAECREKSIGQDDARSMLSGREVKRV
jgi:hypothetical protein